MALHLIPTLDAIEHEATAHCPCNPTQQDVVDDEGSMRPALVHHSSMSEAGE